MKKTTIYALSSGSSVSGVSVIRVSGTSCSDILTSMVRPPDVLPRYASLRDIIDPHTDTILDRGLILNFLGPHSYTGEDMIEFHCHGGRATVDAILTALDSFTDTRLAEAGEFSRRAFENGKFDLTELEGLSDLVSAQTEHQRRQALLQASGGLREIYDSWRDELIRARSLLEANLDFADEDDIDAPSSEIDKIVSGLRDSIISHLDDGRFGEVIRGGFRIVLLGRPNSGKSSLLNALVDRDVAIVTPEAGTTRDVIEVMLDIDGHLVVISDTAGIRETSDIVEREGVRRALLESARADLNLWLHGCDDSVPPDVPEDATLIYTKSDLGFDFLPESPSSDSLVVSVKDSDGLSGLMDYLRSHLGSHMHISDSAVTTRRRHREALEETTKLLESYSSLEGFELKSEQLRICSDCLGRLTGRIDVEDLLDVIFSNFCIGK